MVRYSNGYQSCYTCHTQNFNNESPYEVIHTCRAFTRVQTTPNRSYLPGRPLVSPGFPCSPRKGRNIRISFT